MARDIISSSLDTPKLLDAVQSAGFVVEHHEEEFIRPKGKDAGIREQERLDLSPTCLFTQGSHSRTTSVAF